MKRIVSMALAVMISSLLLIGTSALKVDFNADNVCDVKDALIVLRSVLNNNATDKMDVNGDGKVGLLDVIHLLKTLVNGGSEDITSPTFVVGEVNAAAGDKSVSVPVSVVKNPGILGMTLVVNYDDSVMTLVNSENGDALDMLTLTKPKYYKNGCIFTWYGEALDESEFTDGGILTLTFDVSESAADGSYPVEVSYVEGDIFDANLTPVEIAVRNGSCNIANSTEGGDGESGDNGNTGGEVEEITAPTFVVSNVTASAGATSVSVPVSIVKNPGILGMTLVVSYDDSVMTLVNSVNGDALDMLTLTKPKRYKNGCIFTWYGEALDESEITDGIILTLTFDVSETATSGSYPIEISYVEGDIFDANLTPIEIAIQNGNLKITQ